jgi:hypothetical protein
MMFFHNVGTEWMSSLNQYLLFLDLNKTDFIHTYLVTVNLYYKRPEVEIIHRDYAFPDEDFCLFWPFPHEQLVYMVFDKANLNCTCTILWLLKYADLYSKFNPADNALIYGTCQSLGKKYKDECFSKVESQQNYSTGIDRSPSLSLAARF